MTQARRWKLSALLRKALGGAHFRFLPSRRSKSPCTAARHWTKRKRWRRLALRKPSPSSDLPPKRLDNDFSSTRLPPQIAKKVRLQPRATIESMGVQNSFPQESETHQLECAQQIVSFLFRKTGLSTIVCTTPTVIVGAGNWISFTVGQPVSAEVAFGLPKSSGGLAFASDVFSWRGRARSRTNPSLHLTNLDSGEPLRGHVDAYYWAKNPLRHAGEFLMKKTMAPSDLLKRLQESSRFACGDHIQQSLDRYETLSSFE